MEFLEITPDKGAQIGVCASNNNALYILTSARAKDMYRDYCDKYSREPSSRWMHKRIAFRKL